jgi:cytochrome c553
MKAWFFATTLILSALPLQAQTKIVGDKAFGEYLSGECVTCHQLSGKAVGAIPPIVDVDAESFVALMLAYKTKQRDNQVMQAIAGKLGDDEIAALAVYFESIKPKL